NSNRYQYKVPYFSLHKTHLTIRRTLGFRGRKQEKKNSELMDCRHSTGDDQRLRTQYRR
ncbi:unnamed protein product, partial [Staurois parvus]